jgi:hypothetical protein
MIATGCGTLNSMGEMEQHHGRGEMTSQPPPETSNGGVLGLLRGAALIAIPAGAGVSLALMLCAGQRQNSRILLLLFGIWVLFPFVTALWAYVFSKLWTVVVQGVFYTVILVVTISSLSIYGGVAFGHLRAKVGFVFLVIPLTSWLVIATAAGLAVAVSRRQSRQ